MGASTQRKTSEEIIRVKKRQQWPCDLGFQLGTKSPSLWYSACCVPAGTAPERRAVPSTPGDWSFVGTLVKCVGRNSGGHQLTVKNTHHTAMRTGQGR